MKTTVDLEPELYEAAERLARSQKKSLGQVVLGLLRRSLGKSIGFADASVNELERHNGFDVFSERTGPEATIEAVLQLYRDEGIGWGRCWMSACWHATLLNLCYFEK